MLYAIIQTNGARKATMMMTTSTPQIQATSRRFAFRDIHDSRISFTSLSAEATENKDPERCDDQDKNHDSGRHR